MDRVGRRRRAKLIATGQLGEGSSDEYLLDAGLKGIWLGFHFTGRPEQLITVLGGTSPGERSVKGAHVAQQHRHGGMAAA